MLPTNPERMSRTLRYEFEGPHSARRGEYRVLFALDPDTRVLLVVRSRRKQSASLARADAVAAPAGYRMSVRCAWRIADI